MIRKRVPFPFDLSAVKPAEAYHAPTPPTAEETAAAAWWDTLDNAARRAWRTRFAVEMYEDGPSLNVLAYRARGAK
jgi:hypothetical protein